MSESLQPSPKTEVEALATEHASPQRELFLNALSDDGHVARQSSADFLDYLQTQPYEDKNGSAHNPDNGEYINADDYFQARRDSHLESTTKTYADMSLGELVRAARESRKTHGDSSSALEIEDAIVDRLAQYQEKHGWSGEQTDKHLGRVMKAIFGEEEQAGQEGQSEVAETEVPSGTDSQIRPETESNEFDTDKTIKPVINRVETEDNGSGIKKDIEPEKSDEGAGEAEKPEDGEQPDDDGEKRKRAELVSELSTWHLSKLIKLAEKYGAEGNRQMLDVIVDAYVERIIRDFDYDQSPRAVLG